MCHATWGHLNSALHKFPSIIPTLLPLRLYLFYWLNYTCILVFFLLERKESRQLDLPNFLVIHPVLLACNTLEFYFFFVTCKKEINYKDPWDERKLWCPSTLIHLVRVPLLQIYASVTERNIIILNTKGLNFLSTHLWP